MEPDAVSLGAGETEAITLAVELHADLLLMDDRRGVNAPRDKGIEVTGSSPDESKESNDLAPI